MIDPNEYLIQHDEVLEMQVLCEIITSRRIPFGLIGDFFTDSRKLIFIDLEKQWARDREIDPIVLAKTHDLSKILEMNGTFSETAISNLRDLWKTRQYGQILTQTHGIVNPSERIKSLVESASRCVMVKTIVDYNQTEQTCKLIEVISEINSRGKNISGYSVGLPDFDRAINGIEKGKFYVIGALKKTGKSRFLTYLCAKLSEQGANTLFNSLEMNDIQLNSLIVSHYGNIDSSRLSHQLKKDETALLNVGFSACNEMKWEIYREYTPEDLRAIVEYRQCKKQIDVVCVDFIQRMRVPHLKNDRVREVEYISQRLADMSRELNVAVIALSQLAGAAENLKDTEEVPDMRHYKESQSIAENADAIITMHDPNRHETPMTKDKFGNEIYSPLNLKFRIEQRYGITGNIIPITGDLRTCRFFCQDNNRDV